MHVRGLYSSAMHHAVDCYTAINISEEGIAAKFTSLFKTGTESSSETPPTRLHGIITRKTAVLTFLYTYVTLPHVLSNACEREKAADYNKMSFKAPPYR